MNVYIIIGEKMVHSHIILTLNYSIDKKNYICQMKCPLSSKTSINNE